MIASTHLTLEEVATRSTALGWTVRHDTSALGRPQVILSRPYQYTHLVFTQLTKGVEWQSSWRMQDDEARRLVREIEGREVVS